MSDDKISMRQLLVLLFAALLSPTIHALPAAPAAVAGEGGWLSSLVALPVGLAMCWVTLTLLRGLPEGTGLAGAMHITLGPVLGRIVLAVYLLWGILELAAGVRLCGARILSTGYTNAPLLLYMVLLLGAVLWITRGRLAAFARAGEIFYLILSITLGVVLLLAAFHIEAENLFPIWTEDVPAVLASSLSVLSVLGTAVLGAFLDGTVTRRKSDKSRALRWTAAACLMLTGLQIVNLGNFGPALIARLEQPFFMMVRDIGVHGAFQRAESVIMAVWVLSDLVFAGLIAFACCAMAKELFCLKHGNSAAVPVVVLGLAASVFLFPNAFSLERFGDKILGPASLVLGFCVPLLLLFIAKLRGLLRQKT